jgi:hypothetical protein
MVKPIPLTPDQISISEELSAFAGRLFLRHNVSIEVGVRMLATMVTWMAIQCGLSSEEYGKIMRDMHATMKKAGN